MGLHTARTGIPYHAARFNAFPRLPPPLPPALHCKCTDFAGQKATADGLGEQCVDSNNDPFDCNGFCAANGDRCGTAGVDCTGCCRGETDTDCGGDICPSCADGKVCGLPSDCEGGMCSGEWSVGECARTDNDNDHDTARLLTSKAIN